MAQIFGNFIEQFPPEHDSLELTFTPDSRPIKQRWRNNRLSAHFLADYFSNFLPIDEDDPTHARQLKETQAAVVFVANELLENAMKFNDGTTHSKVRFGIHFVEEDQITAVLFATNSISAAGVDKFQAFIQELLVCDPNELYVQQVEKSAEENSEASGLGFLTMINDYSARLGWKFVQEMPNTITVTAMALLPV
ncbi:DUF6272 family protein [Nostoc sp. 'Lobaria pulmonaria (5183) cyanobiont']|uniref:DUF6272 family protein n=1 Tax=Nostoc sp. 'Lobaria pulmonaria (5183) cyanobiont' TaxID=1618022 RepID=UPI000CF3069E|nr:DUF6272 family protein [Nostoc sp. 'Lobaria pulmonaria (5183) cyanobiont']AVH71277.1 hypothetical protein NLP_2617 [Nostoc sp. 'Lobaria pulmonaria (5183) cyanobiont']